MSVAHTWKKLAERRFCSCLRMIAMAWATGGGAIGSEPKNVPPTLGQLLEMRPVELAYADIIEEYLLCAKGLPGAQIDIENCRRRFDSWADEIRRNPLEGNERQKAQTLVEVLRRGLRNESVPISMQVAYVALGRRNGEPCVFWVDGKTRFEVPELRRGDLLWGISDPEVEHPFSPVVISFPPKEGEARKEWILGPKDELSIFLGLRAVRLEEAGLNDEALVAFSQAHQLSPDCLDHLNGILRVAKKITPLVGHTDPVQLPQRRESPFEEVERLNRMNGLEFEISHLRMEKELLISEQARKRNNRP